MTEPTTTDVEARDDPGLTDQGALSTDHPYVIALELGWFADPSQAKDESDSDYTVAGVIAAAASAKEEGA